MSGQGKYTVYAPEAGEKNNLLGKLFSNSPFSKFVGKEEDYRNIVVGTGNTYLVPVDQKGDSYFGPSVNLDYSGAPDTFAGAKGAWAKAGDPANSYAPDISSPGPGKTDGVDKSTDPQLGANDIKPTYVPAGPNTGTRSPAEQAKKIAASMLGVAGKMGSSS